MREFRILGPLEVLLDGRPSLVDSGSEPFWLRSSSTMGRFFRQTGSSICSGGARAEDRDDLPPERRL